MIALSCIVTLIVIISLIVHASIADSGAGSGTLVKAQAGSVNAILKPEHRDLAAICRPEPRGYPANAACPLRCAPVAERQWCNGRFGRPLPADAGGLGVRRGKLRAWLRPMRADGRA